MKSRRSSIASALATVTKRRFTASSLLNPLNSLFQRPSPERSRRRYGEPVGEAVLNDLMKDGLLAILDAATRLEDLRALPSELARNVKARFVAPSTGRSNL
jgi:predicted kinase